MVSTLMVSTLMVSKFALTLRGLFQPHFFTLLCLQLHRDMRMYLVTEVVVVWSIVGADTRARDNSHECYGASWIGIAEVRFIVATS
jgi:hypothetical protein